MGIDFAAEAVEEAKRRYSNSSLIYVCWDLSIENLDV